MAAYYNEIDPNVAQWLRNLISAGHIAPGVVDERSIEDVTPNDLRGFTQCHFFAGIGMWSYALRLARWPDDRQVWTGSCPCQPFSEAGKGKGSADERHLWPAFYHLVEQCRPSVVFGEQVEAAIKHSWLDLVQSDMERSDYAFAAFGLPAAGFGAPHIRSRLYFVAYSNSNRFDKGCTPPEIPRHGCSVESGGGTINLADSNHPGLEGRQRMPERADQCVTRPDCMASRMANTDMLNVITTQLGSDPEAQGVEAEHGEGVGIPGKPSGTSLDVRSRPRLPTDGFWRDVDWIGCRDSKWRPVEPGTSPLVDGDTSRVVKLRAYGNAIVPQVAQEMISAFMEMGNG